MPTQPNKDFSKDNLFYALVASGAGKQFKRLNKTKDPIVRYTLFLEFLRSIIEVGLTMSEMSLEEKIFNQENEMATDRDANISPEYQLIKARNLELLNKTQHTIDDLKKELDCYFDGFSDWIAQPVYSPDHPFGYHMMKEAEEDLDKKKSQEDV